MIKLKKDNVSLLKGLIESDFLLVNKNLNKKSRFLKSNLNINGSKINYLDSFETLKTLKQFIRILQYLQNNDKNVIYLVVKNKQFIKIAESFFKNKRFNININDSSNIKKSNLENQFLILFDYINNNSLLLKKLFDKNIYLVNKVNTKFEQNNWGTYKIFNELDDFKKFLFFIVLIELTLNKK
jgi:hypothetical protein